MQIKWLVHFTDGTKVEVTAFLVGKIAGHLESPPRGSINWKGNQRLSISWNGLIFR